MDIEQLTKTQITLLAVLVSFVTSIATGIATVTLLDEAPPVVTKTINQVVERTVERVVPTQSQGASVKETTVVVKEEDLITESIEGNASRMVRLVASPGNSNGEDTLVALGTIVSSGGLVITTDTIPSGQIPNITATTFDGKSYKVRLVDQGEEYPSTLLTLLRGEGDSTAFSPAKLADTSTVKLGQTVISLSGDNRTNVSIGIVSELLRSTPGEGETAVLTAIDTNINTVNLVSGSPLFNIFGELVGLYEEAQSGSDMGRYIPANLFSAQIDEHRSLAAGEGN